MSSIYSFFRWIYYYVQRFLGFFHRLGPTQRRLVVIGLVIAAAAAGFYYGQRYLGLTLWVAAVVLFVILLFVLINVAVRRRSQRMDRKFDDALMKTEGVQQLRKDWNAATSELRDHDISRESLPFYMLIGEPQSGKSTTLKKSKRLEFPLGTHAISGPAGTRNCDWWFTDQAILLDTAGRLQFQKEEGDTQEWLEFLGLLRRFRPTCPVNGVIVTIPCTSLLKDSPDDLLNKAKTLRRALVDLERGLQVQFPVYVLITKADKIAGFSDFFSTLDDKTQICGWSRPKDERSAPFSEEQLEHVFEELTDRLRHWRLRVLEDPRIQGSNEKIDRLYGFPAGFAALRAPLAVYLRDLFPKGEILDRLFFRGFFLTCGVQEGTPIGKIASEILKDLGQEPNEDDLQSLFGVQERAIFVDDFYVEKCFPEQGLIFPTRARDKRVRRTRRVGFGLAAAAFVLAAAGVGLLFQRLTRNVIEPTERIEAMLRGWGLSTDKAAKAWDVGDQNGGEPSQDLHSRAALLYDVAHASHPDDDRFRPLPIGDTGRRGSGYLFEVTFGGRFAPPGIMSWLVPVADQEVNGWVRAAARAYRATYLHHVLRPVEKAVRNKLANTTFEDLHQIIPESRSRRLDSKQVREVTEALIHYKHATLPDEQKQLRVQEFLDVISECSDVEDASGAAREGDLATLLPRIESAYFDVADLERRLGASEFWDGSRLATIFTSSRLASLTQALNAVAEAWRTPLTGKDGWELPEPHQIDAEPIAAAWYLARVVVLAHETRDALNALKGDVGLIAMEGRNPDRWDQIVTDWRERETTLRGSLDRIKALIRTEFGSPISFPHEWWTDALETYFDEWEKHVRVPLGTPAGAGLFTPLEARTDELAALRRELERDCTGLFGETKTTNPNAVLTMTPVAGIGTNSARYTIEFGPEVEAIGKQVNAAKTRLKELEQPSRIRTVTDLQDAPAGDASTTNELAIAAVAAQKILDRDANAMLDLLANPDYLDDCSPKGSPRLHPLRFAIVNGAAVVQVPPRVSKGAPAELLRSQFQVAHEWWPNPGEVEPLDLTRERLQSRALDRAVAYLKDWSEYWNDTYPQPLEEAMRIVNDSPDWNEYRTRAKQTFPRDATSQLVEYLNTWIDSVQYDSSWPLLDLARKQGVAVDRGHDTARTLSDSHPIRGALPERLGAYFEAIGADDVASKHLQEILDAFTKDAATIRARTGGKVPLYDDFIFTLGRAYELRLEDEEREKKGWWAGYAAKWNELAEVGQGRFPLAWQAASDLPVPELNGWLARYVRDFGDLEARLLRSRRENTPDAEIDRYVPRSVQEYLLFVHDLRAFLRYSPVGHSVDTSGIKPITFKVTAVRDDADPSNLTGYCSFIDTQLGPRKERIVVLRTQKQVDITWSYEPDARVRFDAVPENKVTIDRVALEAGPFVLLRLARTNPIPTQDERVSRLYLDATHTDGTRGRVILEVHFGDSLYPGKHRHHNRDGIPRWTR